MSQSAPLREIPCREISAIIEAKLGSGLFFSTATDTMPPNTMTIGWGGLIWFFNKPIFLVPVREGRHTYGMLQESREFTVSIPLHDMKAELAFAGSMSGRETRKFENHGLTAAPAQAVNAPIVKECELHLECRVISKAEMPAELINAEVLEQWYRPQQGGEHTLFFGEILRCYYTQEV